MYSIFARPYASGSGKGAYVRFEILERLRKGDARIDELASFIQEFRRPETKWHIDALRQSGMVDYTTYYVDDGRLGDEFGRLRVELTEKGRLIADALVPQALGVANAGADHKLSSLASFYSADMPRLKMLANPAMRLYLGASPYIRSDAEEESAVPTIATAYDGIAYLRKTLATATA